MSRGYGKLQNNLISYFLERDELVTFEQILAEKKLHEEFGSQVGSIRRALRKLIAARFVLALGDGGPGDPHRYCLNPVVVLSTNLSEKIKQKRFLAAMKLLEDFPEVHRGVLQTARDKGWKLKVPPPRKQKATTNYDVTFIGTTWAN